MFIIPKINVLFQGPIAFQDLYGVFYPAVSLNRGVSVTLHTAIDPPSDSDESWEMSLINTPAYISLSQHFI